MATQREIITVFSRTAPIVEIDTEARAAYVRFKRTVVARTESLDRPNIIVTVDFDRENDVVGVELIGVDDFSVHKLLKAAKVTAENADLDRARYVGAGRGQRETVAA